MAHSWTDMKKFLSSNTQDFIEVRRVRNNAPIRPLFLSSNTQDFIEVTGSRTILAFTHHS